MANISIIGLSDKNANGTYVSKGYHDGQLFYEGPNGYLIIYYTSNMPFCNDSGYFLVSVASYYGSVPLYNYKYLTKSINPVTGAWSSLMSTISGEDNLNNLLLDYVSSSSSSSSFSSYSSSSKSSISSNSSSSSSKSSASSFSSLSTLSSYSSESSSSSSSRSSLSSLSSASGLLGFITEDGNGLLAENGDNLVP